MGKEENRSKFNLGSFDSIAKVNEEIKKKEKKGTTAQEAKALITSTKTQEIDLGSLNLSIKAKDLKIQKSLALKKSTIDRLNKLAKRFNTSVSEIADKAIRTILELEN